MPTGPSQMSPNPQKREGSACRAVDLTAIRTRSISDRKDLATAAQFGRPTEPGDGVAAFLNGLPDVLAA